MTTPPLLSLPPELKLCVFSELPVREIVRLRVLCSELEILIDNAGNQATMLQPGQARVRRRIQNEASPLVYAPDTDFLTALMAYVAHRGIWSKAKADTRHGLCLSSKTLASTLLKQHILWHVPEIENEKITSGTVDEFVRPRYGAPVLPHAQNFGLNETWLRQAWQEICHTSGGVFAGAELKVNKAWWPRSPLATLSLPPEVDYYSEEEPSIKGCTSHERLMELFDLPELPQLSRFAYYVDSKWAYEMIEEDNMGNSRLKKAAVMEETRWY